MSTLERIALGGGCFWCTEAVFKMLKGIETVKPGYAGGQTKDPTYKEVSGGETGHAETVYLEYDPHQISLTDILTVFFASHDPTTRDRQENDVGPQYRSIILYGSIDQKQKIFDFIKELNHSSELGSPITTEVKPLTDFYEAEIYHRDYYEHNRTNSYCELIINPKLDRVQTEFARLLKDKSKHNEQKTAKTDAS